MADDFPERLKIRKDGKNARVAWRIRRRRKMRERREVRELLKEVA